jgi:hypothetical protein
MPRASLLARQAKPGYMGIGRHLMQENIVLEDVPRPLLPEPFAAEAPMAAPGDHSLSACPLLLLIQLLAVHYQANVELILYLCSIA